MYYLVKVIKFKFNSIGRNAPKTHDLGSKIKQLVDKHIVMEGASYV